MIRIRSPQDFFAGLMFIAFGVVGAYVARKYPFGTSVRMGPGYLPVVLSWCMISIGVIVTGRGLVLDAEKIVRIKLRPLLAVLGAVLVYAFAIERLGLVISVFLVVVLSAMAIPNFRKIETLILAVGLVAFCLGVFIHGLSLPLSVWPPQ
jgi:hypothetical protein